MMQVHYRGAEGQKAEPLLDTRNAQSQPIDISGLCGAYTMTTSTHNQPRQWRILKPLEAIDSAISLYRAEPRIFLVQPLTVVVVALLYGLASGYSLDGISTFGSSPLQAGRLLQMAWLLPLLAVDPWLLRSMLLNAIVYLCIVVFLSGRIIYLTADRYLVDRLVQKATQRGAISHFFALLPPMLAVLPIMLLSAQISQMLSSLMVWLGLFREEGSAGLAVFGADWGAFVSAWGAGTLALLVLALVLCTRLLLAGPVAHLEGLGGLAALKRSWHLSSGATLLLASAGLLCGLFGGVLITIPLLLVELLPLFGLGDTLNDQLGLVGRLLSQLCEALWFPIPLMSMTLLYYSQRIRQEGYDVSLALLAGQQDADDRFNEQFAATVERDPAQAIVLLDQWLATSQRPSDDKMVDLVMHWRVWARYGCGDPAGALADIEALLTQLPNNAILLCDRAMIRDALGDHAGALADLACVGAARPTIVADCDDAVPPIKMLRLCALRASAVNN